MSTRTLIRGGLVVTAADEVHADVLIEEGRVVAWGGTTTIVDFAVQSVGHGLREGLDAWYAKADGNCAIDYAFHMILSDVNEHTLKEMDKLVQEGITSSKSVVRSRDQGLSSGAGRVPCGVAA